MDPSQSVAGLSSSVPKVIWAHAKIPILKICKRSHRYVAFGIYIERIGGRIEAKLGGGLAVFGEAGSRIISCMELQGVAGFARDNNDLKGIAGDCK